jgi:hypothetical protein
VNILSDSRLQRTKSKNWPIGIGVALFLLTGMEITKSSFADELSVGLVTQDGTPFIIGNLDLGKTEMGYDYQLKLDETKFEEFFLNMRPFICFQGPKHMLCHLPYLYDKGTHVSEADMLDLEYDLLFIHRRATDYGIDPWNGLYYKLRLTEAGMAGMLHEVDLNILAAPPAENVARPITDYDLHVADPDIHSYPTILIQ